ncbi:MAG: hypothetical protein ACRD1V_14280 [Vicinamibacterales bacterium]
MLAAAPVCRAQTLDDVISKYLAARGADKWRQVQTMQMTAQVDSGGRTTPLTVISKRPNLVRQEVTVNGSTIVEAFDGKMVWGINPLVSPDPQQIQGPQAIGLAQQSNFDPVLMVYKQKNYQVDLVGKSKLGDRDVYDIRATQPGGVVQHYFLDATTYLEARVATEVQRGGQTLNSTSDPSDFRNVEGVMMPFQTTQQVSGMPPVVVRVQKVEFNVPVNDSIFRMPTALPPSRSLREGRRP